MKKALKNFLLKKNLYYPLRYSRFFRIYQSIFRPGAAKEQRKETRFYKSFLPPCKLVFDIGAYDGHKTEAFLTLSEKVVGVEPDAESFKILQSRFRDFKQRVILENKAISDKQGFAELHIHHPASAFNTISGKWVALLESDKGKNWSEQIKFTGKQTVETTTLDQMIEKYGVPDFIKIDAEGSEEKIIKGLSRPVRFLSFEILLPDYSAEMEQCLAHIQALDHSAVFNLSRFEKLLLPGFVPKEELKVFIARNNILSFDVVVKMSA